MLTKTNVTYEWNKAQTWDLHHPVCHELRNGLLGKLFPLLLCITTNKVEIHEKTSIAGYHFDVMWTNGHNLQFLWCTCDQTKIFELLLLGLIKWYPSFNHCPFPSPRMKRVKKLTDFFQNTQNLPNALYWKICIVLLCSVFTDPVTYYMYKERWLGN